MFIYNVKFNRKKLFKIFFAILTLIILIMIAVSIYKTFSPAFKTDDSSSNDINYIDSKNYSNILQTVYDNLDNYIGKKICFTGYIYKEEAFGDNQFVLARNMKTNNPDITYIIGFLCEYKKINDFSENTWVKVFGKISKGCYNGEVPVIKVTSIEQVEKPEDELVSMPDSTYIPTINMF